jgi:Ca-activated chloride channel family protein
LGEEGISVSTIGLGSGYNEDLMVSLARTSDGNHVFVESASQLARIFDAEFGDILSVVARDVTVEIKCPEGVRPVRVLGREADIAGDTVTARMSQVVARHEKFLLLEVEMPSRPTGHRQRMAQVQIRYHDLLSETSSSLADKVEVDYSRDSRKVERMANRNVLVAAVEMIAVDNNKRATALRDQGKIEEARKLLLGNRDYLQKNAVRYKSRRLKNFGEVNFEDAENLAPGKWNKRRKAMREKQMMLDFQRSY